MAKKIPFSVVFASDEEIEFPASELNNHNPTVLGWRSNIKNPITPKEIVLRFHWPARISRIQVLAHQYLIPERIELWLHYSSKGAPSTPSSQSFEYLGFVALSDNSSTNYQSRELQSVGVTPKIGTHLKLRLGPSHINSLNQNGQASIIAINILGEELTPKEIHSIQSAASITCTTKNENLETLISSICDDLSFSMYVEENTAEVIREMEARKINAVNDERFEYARKLKLCMGVLRSAGERLGRYALAKRQAVQVENFSTARLRKEQIEMYRKLVLEKLQVAELLEVDGIDSLNDVCSELYASKPTLPSPPSLQDVASALADSTLVPILDSNVIVKTEEEAVDEPVASSSKVPEVHQNKTAPSPHGSILTKHDDPPNSPQLQPKGRSPNRGSPTTSTGSLRRRNKSVPRNSYEDYDERTIPTLRHSHTNEYLRECQAPIVAEPEIIRGRSKLNDREKRQAAIPLLVFGNELVELFYSRQFQDREDGLSRLRSILKGEKMVENSSGSNKIARASTLLLHRAVRDAVFSVFNQAAESVRCMFVDFVPNRVSPSEVARSVDRLLPELLAKSGDPSPRVHTLAQHTILSIASCTEVKDQHLIAPALSRAVGNGTHPRLALSRMQMLEQLVLSQGISSDKQSGLACRTLAECGSSGIHHPAESVRKVAERVLLLVYKVNPRLVRKQLPPDDDITRRNLLYRQLFAEFDKNDMQRKKEMMESKQYTGLAFGALSPPLTNSSKSSPPVEVRNKSNKAENRTNVSFQDTKMRTGKTIRSRMNVMSLYDPDTSTNKEMDTQTSRIMKSKSGHALGQMIDDDDSKDNGLYYYDSLEQCNGKDLDKFKPNPYNLSQQKTLLYDSTLGFIGNNEENGSSRQSSNSDSFEASDNEIRCPFCDWTCQGDPEQLDRHYWRACPVLTKCPQCSQVLEVAALNFHLLNECETRENYIICERCTEAVHRELYEYHLLEDYCTELTTGAARCPLCHEDVNLPLDGGWKRHLLSKSGCPGNISRKRNKT